MERSKSTILQIMLFVGIFLVGTLYFCPAITNLFLMISFSVGAMNLVIAVIASVFTCFLLAEKKHKEAVLASVLGILLLFLCVWLSLLIDDWSWDGNTYHKAITGFMKNGWNPLKESFFSYRDTNFPMFDYIVSPWYDAYPKATETWGACVYALLNNIEAGKSFNLVGTVATIVISCFYLSQIRKLRSLYAFICAMFLALNPITISQMFTYYNDGFMWQMWLICCLSLIYLTFSKDTTYQKESYFLIFATIGIGLNIKFSAAVFFAPVCIAFFIYWCVGYATVEHNLRKRIEYFSKQFLFFVLSVVSAVLLIGATSYVSNAIRYTNPMYGMIGEGAVDILTSNLPAIFQSLPNVLAFFASIFSKSSNALVLTNFEWKLPFTVNPEELLAVSAFDTRIGGWGVLFSGIFLVSVTLLIHSVRLEKYDKKICSVAAIFLGINLLWIAVVPALYWARYYVSPLYLPVLAMLTIFCKPDMTGRDKALVGGMMLLLLLNFMPNCQRNRELLDQTKISRKQYERLQQADKIGEVVVDTTVDGGGEGLYFNLIDLNLSNTTFQDMDDSEATCTLSLAFSIGYKGDTNSPLFCNNIEEYLLALTKIDKTDLVLLISAKDEAGYSLTDESICKMQQLGLAFSLKEQYQNSYLAILDQSRCLAEDCGPDILTIETEISGNAILITSAGANAGNYSSIKINGEEYSCNQRGLNIVLMDRNSGKVLDSVCLDTYDYQKFWR